MIDTIYVEEAVLDHPRARRILDRHPKAARVVCKRYGEVFNRRAQNFRLQKRRPALILARKFDHLVLDAPPGYGIGGARNFYFSHMLNCAYDCRYCFLQGMYQSAHYVVFVNFEDFEAGIDARLQESPDTDAYFFSGYDCDSLVFESMTQFARHFVPFFADRPRAWLELRTKSVQLGELLDMPVVPNVVIAFSMTPQPLADALEHGVPPVARRIAAMRRLAERGWQLGLRFDPLIHHRAFRHLYTQLFEDIFSAVPEACIHSVSLGPMRFPKAMFDTIARLYPDEPLFASSFAQRNGMISYGSDVEKSMHEFCIGALAQHVPQARLFACLPEAVVT
jgi:spore photoproduct lyase